MSDDGVIDLARPQSTILDMVERVASAKRREIEPPPAMSEQVPESEPEPPISPDQLAPLPRYGDPYKAHSLIANKPLATVFFLPKGQLPDGFSYASLERLRLIEKEGPGGVLALLLRFNGSVVTEVLIEGRNLLGLCDRIGRHLIHWVREHPTGRDDVDSPAVFIRRITVREIDADR